MQDSPHPRRRGKRVDTYGFYPLNSRFPLFLSLAQIADMWPLRNGERQSGYCSVSFVKHLQFTDRLLLHIRATLRKRGITVPHDSLARCYRQSLRG